MSEGLSQSEYNALVQDMQEFCISAGLEHRVRPVYREENLVHAQFEVYYGEWRTVGAENKPMQPGVYRYYREDEDARIRAMVARDILA